MELTAPVVVFKSLHQSEAMGLVEANGLTIMCLGQKELFLEPCLFYSIPELQQWLGGVFDRESALTAASQYPSS